MAAHSSYSCLENPMDRVQKIKKESDMAKQAHTWALSAYCVLLIYLIIFI